MSRTLNLRGTFTEGEPRNLNGRILRNSTNPNPPPRIVTSNDFDRYINILKANNRYPIPKELTLPIYTTPYTLDKDLYLAKDSVISFFGTAPAYLNKVSISANNKVYDLPAQFIFTQNEVEYSFTVGNDDRTIVYIEYISNFYKITYYVHRAQASTKLTIPANSYWAALSGDYMTDDLPALTFYEGDQPIISLSAESTPTTDGIGQIVTSSLITQFVFTSN